MSVETTERRLEAVREQLAAPLAEGEQRIVETGSIPISVHVRSNRIDLDDRGEAVSRARALGAPHDWLAIAERVVDQEGFNVNRSGVVFVPVVEGRDIATLVLRLSDCAERVQAALLDSVEA